MAWETRNGKGSYYTRSKRVNGLVVREYIGTGVIAQIVANQDELDCKKRQHQLAKIKEEKEKQISIDRKIDEESSIVQTISDALLLVNGYHYHKGQWRKRRDGPKEIS